MLLNNHYHLTYCTSVYPGETWQEVFCALADYVPALKQQFFPDKPFGIGLRLSSVASVQLLSDNELPVFKQWLDANGLYVFTLNGLAFGNFHSEEVKEQVYQPDWTTLDRLAYTKRLAHILAALLPEGAEGGISTSPLSYKNWQQDNSCRIKSVLAECIENLVELVVELLHIKTATGQTIHLDLEPEPDGLLENSGEVISFYQHQLLSLGSELLMQATGLSEDAARAALLLHLQICYNVAGFAMAYEQPADAFAKLSAAGIKIGKIKLSTALKTDLPDSQAERDFLANRLNAFAEPAYLHPVVARHANNQLQHYPDLPPALQQLAGSGASEWRVRYSVPLYLATCHGLHTTQNEVEEVLETLRHQHLTSHLEIETYTWQVMPAEWKEDLTTFIRRELEWVLEKFNGAIYAENSCTKRSRAYAIPHRN